MDEPLVSVCIPTYNRRDRVQDAIRSSSDDELKVFASQALDCIADGELVRLIVDRIGPDFIPPPTNSLTINRASAQFLRGERPLRKGDRSAAGKQAIRTLQRALVKIAAHHPDGQPVASPPPDSHRGGCPLETIHGPLGTAASGSAARRRHFVSRAHQGTDAPRSNDSDNLLQIVGVT